MTAPTARLVPLMTGRIRRGPRQAQSTAADSFTFGDAWARATLMRDGRVVVEGMRGHVQLDADHGASVQALFRNLGVKEKRR